MNSENVSKSSELRWVYNLVFIIPALWWVLFSLFLLLVVQEIGQIPTFSNPDPKDTLLGWFFQPLLLGSIPMVMGLLGVGLVGLVFQFVISARDKYYSWRVAIYFVSLSVLFMIWTSGLTEWLVD